MLKSMTGFGRGEYLDKDYRFVVEIKAVNHRYNEIVIRMPKKLNVLEDRIRKIVSNSLLRGRIDVFITVEEYNCQNKIVRVDKELAIAYYNALRDLADIIPNVSEKEVNNIYYISKCPDVLILEEREEDVEIIWPKLKEAIDESVNNLLLMRTAEGGNIAKDLIRRIEKLQTYIMDIEARAPQVVDEYRKKIYERISELLAAVQSEPDEIRLMQETAIFADRTNIHEEIIRLKSHIIQLKANLNTSGPVGRKLDFIIQEINREANTIASKANDYTIANLVVEIKSEIEKVREQIQNIE